MVLINIGVHKLESYKNSKGIFENSYFIHRSYLNYVIFAPQSTEIFYDYFASKGGVGKQIFTDASQINHAPGKIFNKFGASVLMTNPKKMPPNAAYKLEYFGEDFVDKDICYPWDKPDEMHWFFIHQRGKKFLVTDENLIVDDGDWLPNPEKSYSESKIKHIRDILNIDFDYLLPRLHKGEFFLQSTPQKIVREKIDQFIGHIK